ncbi:sirohydrochlorin chelatase [Gordonia caeni]|uniref:Sirohydrochlorin chelatase n=1 Tax=Gordonia caeni TaxID=1007097 RepID=A0ABP7P332_9ACTN
MNTLLVAHGTRNPRGVAMIGDLARAMSQRMSAPVRVAFVDVLGPSPEEALAALPDGPVRVVPAFLARGHHVCHDLPERLAVADRPGLSVSTPLGPSPVLAQVLDDRLSQAGARSADALVLAAAGSADPRALIDLEQVAAQLAQRRGGPVHLAFAAPPKGAITRPSVADAVAQARRSGARRVAVASYLLADGLFQQRLEQSGADAVGRPLGLHPAVVGLACARAQSVHAGAPLQTASR